VESKPTVEESHPGTHGRARAWWIAVLGVWAAAVVTGIVLLSMYSAAPGAGAEPPASWPQGSAIVRSAGLATIVMLAHPQCPCTRASVGELAELMARAQGHATAHVLFLRPSGVGDDWEKTDLWRSAAAIPGVTVSTDEGGVEAARFAAKTSGQTVVYDAAGRLIFHGGITAARGHAGDNPGRTRILALLTRGVSDRSESPVFGCSLDGPISVSP